MKLIGKKKERREIGELLGHDYVGFDENWITEKKVFIILFTPCDIHIPTSHFPLSPTHACIHFYMFSVRKVL